MADYTDFPLFELREWCYEKYVNGESTWVTCVNGEACPFVPLWTGRACPCSTCTRSISDVLGMDRKLCTRADTGTHGIELVNGECLRCGYAKMTNGVGGQWAKGNFFEGDNAVVRSAFEMTFFRYQGNDLVSWGEKKEIGQLLLSAPMASKLPNTAAKGSGVAKRILEVAKEVNLILVRKHPK